MAFPHLRCVATWVLVLCGSGGTASEHHCSTATSQARIGRQVFDWIESYVPLAGGCGPFFLGAGSSVHRHPLLSAEATINDFLRTDPHRHFGPVQTTDNIGTVMSRLFLPGACLVAKPETDK
jgi:hypothetical protein